MSTTVQRHHVEAWLGDTYPDLTERDRVVDAILATGSAWEADWLRAVAAHDDVIDDPDVIIAIVAAAARDLTRHDTDEALDRLEAEIHTAWVAGIDVDALRIAADASLGTVLGCIPELDT